MPIYEYECLGCNHQFQALVLSKSEEKRVSCPKCESKELKRLISRVVYHLSESDRLANYNPNARKDDSFFKDSRNIGLHAKWRAKQMGVDLGKQFEEKLDKLRTDPGSVIKDSE